MKISNGVELSVIAADALFLFHGIVEGGNVHGFKVATTVRSPCAASRREARVARL